MQGSGTFMDHLDENQINRLHDVVMNVQIESDSQRETLQTLMDTLEATVLGFRVTAQSLFDYSDDHVRAVHDYILHGAKH